MRTTSMARAAAVAAVALGGLWGAPGPDDAPASVEVAHAGTAGGGQAETSGIGGEPVAAQPTRPAPARPGGPPPTPTQVPIVPPTPTPTQIRPDRTPGALFEPKLNPNVKAAPSSQSSGILVSPVGDVAQTNPDPAAQTRIDTELVLVPEHMRPGTHTLELKASATKSLMRTTREGACPPPALQTEGLLVGWHQMESDVCFPLEGSLVQVAQTAVNFDLGKLDEVGRLELRRAVLHHDEGPVQWTDADRNLRDVAGCVAALGIATSDWENGFHENLFPNTGYLNVAPNSSREWDVTVPLERQLIRAAPRLGFVLRGALEQLEGDDDTSCLSRVSNIRLLVTYDVPESNAPPSMPR